jgi:hypothetical protein
VTKPATEGKKHAGGDRVLQKALSHPMRHRILDICDEREASPTELAEILDERDRRGFKRVTYHVSWLHRNGCLELVATDKRHGGEQHFYKTVRRPVLDTPEAEEMSRVLRESQSSAILPLVLDDLRRASEGRTFDDHAARSLLRMKIVLDEEGIAESGEAAMDHLEKLKEIQARSAERLSRKKAPGRTVATETLIFPLPDSRS